MELPPSGMIVINGVSYNYTLTPSNAQPVAVSPIPMMGRSGEEIHTTMLLSHEVKNGIVSKGPKAGQPYELHTFRGSDNRKYVTFKPEIAAKASPIVGRNEPIRIIGIRGNRGDIRIVDIQ